jgi:1-phosphatidylinositol-3-phosphate 5-kinase
MDGKPRLVGKGKTPRKPSLPTAPQASPGGHLMRGIPRRVMGAGSRVTSIARHFDKISRDAERDRAKRISLARGKRAGRVGVTKARVQVFNNVRDAFKDEFDSDSSAADNEEEADLSDVSVDSTGRAKPRRKQSSPAKPRPALLPPHAHVPPTPPPKKAHQGDDETEPETTTPKPQAPEAGPSTFGSELYPETDDPGASKIASDRLHIELAPFDTAAPLPSIPATPAGLITEDEAGKKGLSQMSQISESEMSSGGGERSSILKTLTGLWAIRAGDFTPLDYPLSAAEHIFVDSRVIVREHEPTSIIAFTLCSKQYREQIRSVAAASKARAARAERAQHSTLPSEPSMLEEVGNERPWDLISVDELDEPSLAGAGTHLKYEFEAGSSTISCRIFFAEQFAALRQAVQCEDGFIESLARCAKFDASGGKSGSAFLKTKDDRFIVKEISRYEMDALTKFAPAYFEYTSTAFERQRPTALAKTYGIFKIGYRNGVTGRTMHMNVLVQENLFYGRHFTKIYDLKGSTRNRLIKPTGRANEVLLDENLMEISHTSPLYLRDHAKLILRTALWNDTLFLSNLNVMDYSLVVGVDAENKELVVGVVDYIRTFTW